MISEKKIAVIGLGYVGLPLAVAFGRIRRVVGFDKGNKRIDQLKKGCDHTMECSVTELKRSKFLVFSSDIDQLKDCQIYIICVPTPVSKGNRPDLSFLEEASSLVGSILKKNDLVIYESTVFPGATEEVCAPILESKSGLQYNSEFFCGYSPERINPGDMTRRLENIVKVTSGSTPEIANEVDALYSSIIPVGTFKAKSIRVAEAAKVIENTQRDVNIALMNELSLIFNRLNIDTLEVLEAANTKWNFLPFRPGLVGGHCIGVDPYYLTYKAEEVNYFPQVILAGRKINEEIANHIVSEVIKLMLKKSISILKSKILVLGIGFKENCPDVRNSKVVDIVNGFVSVQAKVDVFDPIVNSKQVEEEYQLTCLSEIPKEKDYSAVVLAVAHNEFIKLGYEVIRNFGKKNSVLYDVKGVFDKDLVDGRL